MLIPDESRKSPSGLAADPRSLPTERSSATTSIGSRPTFPEPGVDAPPPYEGLQNTQAAPHTYGVSPKIFAQASGPSIPYREKTSPPCFYRHAPLTITRSSFNSMHLTARKSRLAGGFPVCPPPIHGGESSHHPFATRDVTEDDWVWFLNDLNKAAQLKPNEKNFSRNVPIFGTLPIIAPMIDVIAAQVILLMKSKPVAALVDQWNHHFFGPRYLEVILTKGSTRVSGPPGAAMPSLAPNLSGSSSRSTSHSQPGMPNHQHLQERSPFQEGSSSSSAQMPSSSCYQEYSGRKSPISSISSESLTSSSSEIDDIIHGDNHRHASNANDSAEASRVHGNNAASNSSRARRREARRARRIAEGGYRRTERRLKREERRLKRKERRLKRIEKRDSKQTKMDASGIYDDLYRLVVISV